jgi:MOSC domain-containing protein YiiM
VTTGAILAVCVSGVGAIDLPGRGVRPTGIDKRPVAGPVAVGRLGLAGDAQANQKVHGGEGQAVYAYAQEDADVWAAELDRALPAGRFGENLRTTGVDLTAAVLGERWRVGTTVLEVTAPRTPCMKLQTHWGVPRLVRRFTDRGRPGAYLRVIEPGEIAPGDSAELVHRPGHGVTIGLAFRAFTTEKHQLADLLPALAVLPDRDKPKVTAAVDDRTGASA